MRISHRSIIVFLILTICFTTGFFWFHQARMIHVNEYGGKLKIGTQLPDFIGFTTSDIEVGPTTPSGRFYVHFLSKDSPLSCIDLECGDIASLVTDRGGHLIGTCDLKGGKIFGVEPVHDGKNWVLSDSLMVVADQNGVIQGIYKNAKLSHLKEILEFHNP